MRRGPSESSLRSTWKRDHSPPGWGVGAGSLGARMVAATPKQMVKAGYPKAWVLDTINVVACCGA